MPHCAIFLCIISDEESRKYSLKSRCSVANCKSRQYDYKITTDLCDLLVELVHLKKFVKLLTSSNLSQASTPRLCNLRNRDVFMTFLYAHAFSIDEPKRMPYCRSSI